MAHSTSFSLFPVPAYRVRIAFSAAVSAVLSYLTTAIPALEDFEIPVVGPTWAWAPGFLFGALVLLTAPDLLHRPALVAASALTYWLAVRLAIEMMDKRALLPCAIAGCLGAVVMVSVLRTVGRSGVGLAGVGAAVGAGVVGGLLIGVSVDAEGTAVEHVAMLGGFLAWQVGVALASLPWTRGDRVEVVEGAPR